MDNLKIKIPKLANFIDEIGILMENLHRYSVTSKMILGGGAIISVFSVLTLSRWVSVPMVVIFSGAVFYYRSKFFSMVSQIDEIHSFIKEIHEFVAVLQEESNRKTEKISDLKSQIDKISSSQEMGPHVNSNPVETEKDRFELYFEEIIKRIQKLDIEVEDFGSECASYMRKEFSKTLRICDMKFVDYSDEERLLFVTETAAIDNIDCTAKAIVTISSPRQVILKGHAFIPETANNI